MALVDGLLFTVFFALPLGLLGLGLLREGWKRHRHGVRGGEQSAAGGRPSLDVVGLAVGGLALVLVSVLISRVFLSI